MPYDNTKFNCCTASQMWLLGRLLPILVGEYVSEDDEHWCNYLLLDIVDIMFARRITDTLGCLHLLIEEHHANFHPPLPRIHRYSQDAFHDTCYQDNVEVHSTSSKCLVAS